MLYKLQSLLNRRNNYKYCFETEAGKEVLKDLANFCKYNEPTFVAGDPYATAFNEGMRRVFLRMKSLSNMTDLDLDKIDKLTGGIYE